MDLTAPTLFALVLLRTVDVAPPPLVDAGIASIIVAGIVAVGGLAVQIVIKKVRGPAELLANQKAADEAEAAKINAETMRAESERAGYLAAAKLAQDQAQDLVAGWKEQAASLRAALDSANAIIATIRESHSIALDQARDAARQIREQLDTVIAKRDAAEARASELSRALEQRDDEIEMLRLQTALPTTNEGQTP